MVAKLIVTGDNREQAIERALSALERFHVKGIRTTIPFCKSVLHNEIYRKGDFDTSFIETQLTSIIWRELMRNCWQPCLPYIPIPMKTLRKSAQIRQ